MSQRRSDKSRRVTSRSGNAPREGGSSRNPAAGKPEADWLITAWVLSVLTTLVCLSVSGALRWYVSHLVGQVAVNEQVAAIGLLAGFMLFAALVVGLGSLSILSLVHFQRRGPIPRSATIFGIVVGLAPLVWAIVVWAIA